MIAENMIRGIRELIAYDGGENIEVMQEIGGKWYLVGFDRDGERFCTVVEQTMGQECFEQLIEEWPVICKDGLVKKFLRLKEEEDVTCKVTDMLQEGIVTEDFCDAQMEIFNDGTLEVDIRNFKGRKKCKGCGKKPDIAYWMTGKVAIQCKKCRGNIYHGNIQKEDMMLHPAIYRALDKWCEGQKA